MFNIVQYKYSQEVFDSYTPKRNRKTRKQAVQYIENRANAVARVQIMEYGVAQIGCGTEGAAWLRQRAPWLRQYSSSACSKAGPSSNLVSTPQRRSSAERKLRGKQERHSTSYRYKNTDINKKKVAACQQSLKKNYAHCHTRFPYTTLGAAQVSRFSTLAKEIASPLTSGSPLVSQQNFTVIRVRQLAFGQLLPPTDFQAASSQTNPVHVRTLVFVNLSAPAPSLTIKVPKYRGLFRKFPSPGVREAI